MSLAEGKRCYFQQIYPFWVAFMVSLLRYANGIEGVTFVENAIKISHLNYRYADAEAFALKDVSFEVQKGEWVAIIGHNGSGKSTLAKNINGLLAPESGEVVVAGMTLSEETVWQIRQKVGIVFQNPDNQFVGATVADDVAFGLENHGVPRDEMIQRVDAALERVKMTAFSDREPHVCPVGRSSGWRLPVLSRNAQTSLFWMNRHRCSIPLDGLRCSQRFTSSKMN